MIELVVAIQRFISLAGHLGIVTMTEFRNQRDESIANLCDDVRVTQKLDNKKPDKSFALW